MVHTKKIKTKKNKKTIRRDRKIVGGQLDAENERLVKLLFSLLTVLKFDTNECHEIYDIISIKISSEVGLDLRNVLEFVNLSFSIDQSLTESHDVPTRFCRSKCFYAQFN